ncbi:uncharacterized protein [Miscanthus floridulus]|uniref:uncharacterized protein n=1 Tax=Miscanthus floridulus TaxID=154761 RepID=UPI0034599A1C
MKLRMQAHDLWEAVEGGPVQFRDDRRALEVIIAAVPKELGLPLLDKAAAKEAWDAIAATHIGVDRVRRAMLQRLRREWENIDVKPGEPVEDFALRLSTLHQQLVLNGDRDIDEARVVEKFLCTVPTKRRKAQKKLAVLVSRTSAAVAEDAAVEVDADGAEVLAVAADVEKAMASAVLAPTRASTAIRKGIGRVNVPSRTVMEQSAAAGEEIMVDAAAETVEEAVAAVTKLGSKEDMKGVPSLLSSTPELNYIAQRVEFFEPRARAYLGADDEEMAGSWYLDSGATHHMTGQRDLFSDLNMDVRGTVRFGDASKVEIKGVGSIVFEAKT